MTQVTYRWGNETYFSQPFDEVRDGPSNAGGVSQTLYFDKGRSANAGFQIGAESPRSETGNDYDLRFYQANVSYEFSAWWKTVVDLMYLYRYDDYRHLNSFADFQKRRHDSIHYLFASVERPVTSHVSAVVSYLGTFDDSNIPLFAYDRNIVSLLLRVAF
jgi:hypothetical protein